MTPARFALYTFIGLGSFAGLVLVVAFAKAGWRRFSMWRAMRAFGRGR